MDIDTVVLLSHVLLMTSLILRHQRGHTIQLRLDLNAAHHQLREGINENGQRLARIEGFLAASMPTVADESIDAGSK